MLVSWLEKSICSAVAQGTAALAPPIPVLRFTALLSPTGAIHDCPAMAQLSDKSHFTVAIFSDLSIARVMRKYPDRALCSFVQCDLEILKGRWAGVGEGVVLLVDAFEVAGGLVAKCSDEHDHAWIMQSQSVQQLFKAGRPFAAGPDSLGESDLLALHTVCSQYSQLIEDELSEADCIIPSDQEIIINELLGDESSDDSYLPSLHSLASSPAKSSDFYCTQEMARDACSEPTISRFPLEHDSGIAVVGNALSESDNFQCASAGEDDPIFAVAGFDANGVTANVGEATANGFSDTFENTVYTNVVFVSDKRGDDQLVGQDAGKADDANGWMGDNVENTQPNAKGAGSTRGSDVHVGSRLECKKAKVIDYSSWVL